MDTDAVLTLLQDVADEVISPRFRDLASEEVVEKNPGDLVTVADREAEALITKALTASYPDALVLGEEAEAGDPTLEERYRAADHAFTVDPVDGTRNFVHGSPDHAVMVAEIRSGAVVRSWIWQPQHQLSYVAELGAGAWRNGERLERPPLGEALRGVTSRRSWVGRALGALAKLDLTWVCCGVDYPKLVEGAADYALYHKSSPWDHAPGSLLLSEAGCFLGTSDGVTYAPQAPRPAGLVAAADRTTYDLVQGLLSDLPGR
ncbi:inositol monophosphatase [Nocardioides sp.]|uniref:inositol monophosphatase family protein n=1 Tax=Nocardioides sp. TaxID=35761 RepID=UPI002D7E41C7|nr:inositol monophosphatase [Nocardioides sp.]HET8959587.1 inositol monophosphatase [Nocardioides sp.]